MTTSIFFVLGAFFNALAAFLLKQAFSSTSPRSNQELGGPAFDLVGVALALGCFFASFIFYGLVLSKTNLSIAQPVFTALSMLCIICISVFLLDETLSPRYFVGMILIIVGIFVVSTT